MKYTVTHTVKVEFYYDVDAESKEDALDKALAVGGRVWLADCGVGWDGSEVDTADGYGVTSSRWDAEERIDV